MSDLRFRKIHLGEPRDSRSAVLRLEHVSVTVGIRRVVEDLDLEVVEGDVVWVSGPNGSGKTMLLNAIAGIAPARIVGGKIFFGAEDITRMAAHDRARRGLAYLRQREHVFRDLTVEENLRLALGSDPWSRLREPRIDPAPVLPASKRAGLLSGGEQQRLAWAMAVLRPSRLLLADEPEAGLSTTPRLPANRTIILVSHNAPLWRMEGA